MPIERWGAFSVIDHKDARKLAAEVLLYDRLLIPTPPQWDRERWIKEGWEPDQLDARLNQLGNTAVKAGWDQDEQKDWGKKLKDLRQDVHDINIGLEVTRRVLVDHHRKYLPPGISTVEAFSAYQSEDDFKKFTEKENLDKKQSHTNSGIQSQPMAEFDFLVAQRIAIPDDEDPEISLDRALTLVNNDKFRQRRNRFHDWQHDLLQRGILPKDGAKDLPRLVREYNEAVEKGDRSYRIETVMLVGTLSAAALAAAASLAPALFVGIGIGALAGAKVVSLGTAASGAVIQIAKHRRNRKPPDNPADLSGAMFHQIEKETGWKLRTEPQQSSDVQNNP